MTCFAPLKPLLLAMALCPAMAFAHPDMARFADPENGSNATVVDCVLEDGTGENAGLYRVERDDLTILGGLGYRVIDDDGMVHIADIATAAPEQDQACVNIGADESVKITMRLPVEPVVAETPIRPGVALRAALPDAPCR